MSDEQLGAPSLTYFPLSAMFNTSATKFNTSATKLNSSATKFKLTLTTPKFNNASIHCPVQQTLCTLQSQEVCYKLISALVLGIWCESNGMQHD